VTERFEILEHTADVGLQAEAPTREEVFAAIGEGVATILGAWFPGEGKPWEIRAEAADPAALLAAWVEELLYAHEAGDAVFGDFEVRSASDTQIQAEILLAPRAGRELAGQGVKAATYHRLAVEQLPYGRWRARVYLDV